MRFIFKADGVIEADDLDDAFAKLEAHFEYLQNTDLVDPMCFESGNISIEPIN